MPALHLRASIVVVGDEILGGFVGDTNSGWLAQRLRVHGVPLDRIVTVPDTVPDVEEALRTELARARPRLVVTSGGIGSTPDDLTLAAVATTLGRGLHLHPVIDAAIDDAVARAAARGRAVTAEHAASMRKMARVPEGSTLLPGAEGGVAPGVAVDVGGGAGAGGGATVVVLPGVPSEFRRIVSAGVEPALLAGRGRPEHVVEVRHTHPESALNPVLELLVAEARGVHVGSYPGPEVVVRLQGPEGPTEAAAAAVRAFLADLERTDPPAPATRG